MEHKCCKTYTDNPDHTNNECYTHVLLDSKSEAYTVNGSSAEKDTSQPPVSFSMDEAERKAKPFRLKVLHLHSAAPPVFLVKGIAKIAGGYKVTFCLINCNLFGSSSREQKSAEFVPTTTSSTSSSTSTSTTTPETATVTATEASSTTAATENTNLLPSPDQSGEISDQPGPDDAGSVPQQDSGETGSGTGTGSGPGHTLPHNPSALVSNVMAVARRINCFSGDMTVQTPQGVKNMESLQIGQEILVAKGPKTLVYEPIEWFYHKEPNQTAAYLNIQTKSGAKLSITPDHLLIFRETCSENMPKTFYQFNKDYARFASRIKPGDCLPVQKNGGEIAWDPVVEIWREFKRGAHSPMTATGTVVVNDVHVSCYSHFESHGVQHLIYEFLNTQWSLWSAIQEYFSGGKLSLDLERQGVPKSIEYLIPLAELVADCHLY